MDQKIDMGIPLPANAKPSSTEQAELLALVKVLERRKKWLIGPLVVMLALAIAYCIFVPRLYEAEARILLGGGGKASPLAGAASAIGLSLPSPSGGVDIDTAAQVINSWTLQSRALALLEAQPKFFRECTLGQRQLHTIADIPQELRDVYNAAKVAPEPTEAQKAMIKKLTVRRVGVSNLLRVRTLGHDVLATSDFVNALCAAYLLWRQETSRFAAELALNALRKELADAQRALRAAEDRLEEFQRTRSLVVADAQAQDLVGRLAKAEEKLANLDASLASQRAQLRYLEKAIKKTQPTIVSAKVVSANPLVQQIKRTLTDLYTQRAELLTEYTEQSEKVRAVDEQIAELKKQLADTVENLVSSQTEAPSPLLTNLLNSYAQARAAIIAMEVRRPILQASVNKLRQAVEQLPPDIRQLATLKREAEYQQQRYMTLRQQVQIQEAAREQTVADDSILTAAEVLPWQPHKPVRPRVLTALALALLLGLGLGVVLAIFAEQLDETYPTVEAAETEVGVAALGAIPQCPGDHMPPVTDPNAPPEVRRALVAVATALQVSRPSPTNQIIAITGTRRGEGRTSVACNLGLTIATMGRRVLVLDCDLDHPGVDQFFGVRPSHSLVQVLDGVASPEQARARPRSDLALDIMTLGVDAASAMHWIGTQGFPEALDQFRKEYDTVIIDLAPCTETNEVAWISSLSDATLLLFVVGETPRSGLIRVHSSLMRSGARIAGLVVNRYRHASVERT